MAGRAPRVAGVSVVLLVVVGVAIALLLRRPAPHPTEPVRIADGLVQGTTREGDLTIYRGIPYAAPPVGELRWRPPQPPAPWKGVLKANAFKPVCPQIGPAVPGMEVEANSEDCLYLNLWTPDPRPTAKLPVMVWIYGGHNDNGSGSARLYWGDQLARRGVLVVTFNYRVGALGLMAHPELSRESEHGSSGNYLLLDQIAALRWVQQNIAVFGGDPGNVTVFGQSAGSYNISKLIVSPLATGLFRRAIGESSADFGPVDSGEGPRSLATEERLGVEFVERFHVSSIAEMRRISADKILAVSKPDMRLNVDGYVSPKDSYQLYSEGKQQPVDLLVGYTENDGAEAGPADVAAFEADVRKKYRGSADRMLGFYPHETVDQAKRSWVRLQTEEGFEWQAITWARLHRATPGRNTYLYIFTLVPPFFKKVGAAHGAELPYLFGFMQGRTTDEIQTYWTNFARTGNPNGPGLPPWPAFDARQQVLEIGDTMKVTDLPHPKEYQLMDAFMASLAR